MTICRRALVFLAPVVTATVCRDSECVASDSTDATHASAMLQVKASKVHVDHSAASLKQDAGLADMHESRTCISNTLKEAHVQAVLAHKERLAKQNRTDIYKMGHGAELATPVAQGSKVLPVLSTDLFAVGRKINIDEGPLAESNKIVGFGSLILETPLKFNHDAGVLITVKPSETTTTILASTPPQTALTGATASLDAVGFKATTSLCCPSEMEQFFDRLLELKGYASCSKPHVQGLMHWFSCVPDMDFQYMLEVMANGNPCKYWAPVGTACPTLSPECQGNWC